ncbi:putative HicB family RNase H-like nuclease [Fontibacillus solani]|uniref:Putative HicB family RNase H-like nuclease n=1 Tax=Fontibacillus solani TaxID=1572857 RepID=A0A7W3SZ14_9BACL|nr:antitoxin [Fontibacillus solani]MBA9088830.1 putative HicB family RNase H-like nuclease [Fontibacillus solani]
MANPKGEAANKAKRKYNDANYERIPLDVKRGLKAVYKEAADAKGMSLNSYIQEAIKEKMERDNKTTEE